jgi:hypothetical protein
MEFGFVSFAAQTARREQICSGYLSGEFKIESGACTIIVGRF